MSALGHKQTFAVQKGMSALPPQQRPRKRISRNGHVRLTPGSGHVRCKNRCPLSAKSGHQVYSTEKRRGNALWSGPQSNGAKAAEDI